MSEKTEKADGLAIDLDLGEFPATESIEHEGFDLDLAFAGVCAACDHYLEDDGEAFGRLRCPECGFTIGPVFTPRIGEEGEPADPVDEWVYVSDPVTIKEARAAAMVAVTGTCECGTRLAENTEGVQFGTASPLACPDCRQTVGYATSWSVLPTQAEEVA